VRSYHTHESSDNLFYTAADNNERRRLKRRGWEKISYSDAIKHLSTRSRAMQDAGHQHFGQARVAPFGARRLLYAVQERGEYRVNHAGVPEPTGTTY
jgi:long-subunit acyl-CoA synthetase (AMP-forming)